MPLLLDQSLFSSYPCSCQSPGQSSLPSPALRLCAMVTIFVGVSIMFLSTNLITSEEGLSVSFLSLPPSLFYLVELSPILYHYIKLLLLFLPPPLLYPPTSLYSSASLIVLVMISSFLLPYELSPPLAVSLIILYFLHLVIVLVRPEKNALRFLK